jgi:hypothetical protein
MVNALGLQYKKLKHFCNKKYKTLKKEVVNDSRGQKDFPCSWICSINIVKMAALPKEIYRFNEIPIKISTMFKKWKNQF